MPHLVPDDEVQTLCVCAGPPHKHWAISNLLDLNMDELFIQVVF